MRFPGRQRDAPEPGVPRPTADDFKPEAVQKAVLLKTVQHPAALIPAAAGALTFAASMVGRSPMGVAVGLGLLFLGAATWVWNFFVRGPAFAEEHVQALAAARDRHDEEEIVTIGGACKNAGFQDGAKEADELKAAYEKLLRAIQQHFGPNDGNAERLRLLAKDTFREGVKILRRALGVFSALKDVDLSQLEVEVRGWKRQLSRAEEGSTAASTLSRQIESHQKRIESFEKREEQLRQLIAEVNDLESVLEASSLQVFDLAGRDASVVFDSDGSATRLERAIAAARRVEERLGAVGGTDISVDVADDLRAAARKSRQ